MSGERARWLLEHLGVHTRGVGLGVEILAGGLGYLIGATVLARKSALDFLTLLKRGLRKRISVA